MTVAQSLLNADYKTLADYSQYAAIPSAGMLYNGSTWDRERSKFTTTVLVEADRTSLTYFPALYSFNCTAVYLYCYVVTAGTGSLTLALKGSGNTNLVYATGKTPTATQSIAVAVGAGMANVTDDYLGNMCETRGTALPHALNGYIYPSDSSTWRYAVYAEFC